MSKPTILIADDDPDDRLLIREAFEEAGLQCRIFTAENGQDLLDLLHGEGAHSEDPLPRLPDLVLLDLNMPLMDGREALKRIKTTPGLKMLPVVVLTTSRSDQDIQITYKLGVSSFMSKPDSFPALVERVKVLHTYWFESVRRPDGEAVKLEMQS